MKKVAEHPQSVETIQFTAANDFPVRADVCVTDHFPSLTRSSIKSRFVSLDVNGKRSKLSRKVEKGDILVLSLLPEPPSFLVPENIPVHIVWENADALVVEKAQGMVTHPASGHMTGTLANALAWKLLTSSGRIGGTEAGNPSEADNCDTPERAGIVHRLDKDTSGLIIAAKNTRAREALASQFRNRECSKTYWAIVIGSPKEKKGLIDFWMGRDPSNRKKFARVKDGTGKRSITRYESVIEFGGYALLKLSPKTGRTHQLRVHLSDLGCPILGDPLYGRKDKRFPEATLMLHAANLSIRVPGESDKMDFVSPLPLRFAGILKALNGGKLPCLPVQVVEGE